MFGYISKNTLENIFQYFVAFLIILYYFLTFFHLPSIYIIKNYKILDKKKFVFGVPMVSAATGSSGWPP